MYPSLDETYHRVKHRIAKNDLCLVTSYTFFSSIKDPLECVTSRFGVKCVWNRKKEVCEMYSAGIQRTAQETCHTTSNQTNNGCKVSENTTEI